MNVNYCCYKIGYIRHEEYVSKNPAICRRCVINAGLDRVIPIEHDESAAIIALGLDIF